MVKQKQDQTSPTVTVMVKVPKSIHQAMLSRKEKTGVPLQHTILGLLRKEFPGR